MRARVSHTNRGRAAARRTTIPAPARVAASPEAVLAETIVGMVGGGGGTGIVLDMRSDWRSPDLAYVGPNFCVVYRSCFAAPTMPDCIAAGAGTPGVVRVSSAGLYGDAAFRSFAVPMANSMGDLRFALGSQPLMTLATSCANDPYVTTLGAVGGAGAYGGWVPAWTDAWAGVVESYTRQMYGVASTSSGAPGGFLGWTAASHVYNPLGAWGCANKCAQFSDSKRVVDAVLAAPAAYTAFWTPITNMAQLNAAAVALYGSLSVASDYTGPDHTWTLWVALANGDYLVAADCRSLSSWGPCMQAPRGTTWILGVGVVAYNGGARNVVSWYVLQGNGVVAAGIANTPDLGGGKGAAAFGWYTRAVAMQTGTWTPVAKSLNNAVDPISITDSFYTALSHALAVPVYNNASTPVLLGVVAGEKLTPLSQMCGDPCRNLDFAPRAAANAAQTLPLSPTMPAPAAIFAGLLASWMAAGDGLSSRPLSLSTPTAYFEVFPCVVLPSAPDCALLPPGSVSYRVVQAAVFGDSLLRAFTSYRWAVYVVLAGACVSVRAWRRAAHGHPLSRASASGGVGASASGGVRLREFCDGLRAAASVCACVCLCVCAPACVCVCGGRNVM